MECRNGEVAISVIDGVIRLMIRRGDNGMFRRMGQVGKSNIGKDTDGMSN